MSRKIVETNEAPAAIGPYSQGVLASGSEMLFISGQISLDPETGEVVGEGDVAIQTQRIMKSLGAILAEAGLGFPNVVKTTIYLADLGDFAVVNEIYAERFDAEPPARATVQVAGLPKGVLVEIDAIAMR